MSIDRSDAMHLLRRTGLTPALNEVTPLLALTRDELVDWIFDFSQNPGVVWTPPGRDWSAAAGIRGWWIDRMASAPRPLHERVTLFWHNHFATAFRKVGDATLMWNQQQIFRSQGLGDFNVLAKAVSTDPAMLVWLDGAYSTKWGPNENFSRELMELFLVGAGNGYSELDVREMARAWTGWTLTKDVDYNITGSTFNGSSHDTAAKTIFGVSANWEGTQVLDAMIVSGGSLGSMRMPVARHLAKKLWTWFAYPNPDSALVEQLATLLASTPGMNIGSFLRSMFKLDAFYTAAAKDGLVRDPLLWASSLLRTAKITYTQSHLEWYLDQLSMYPLDPPNVSGWRSNRSWMTLSAFWKRSETAYTMFQAAQQAAPNGSAFLAGSESLTPTAMVDLALSLFGEDRITAGSTTHTALVAQVALDRTNTSWAQKANLARTLALTPEYSLA
jgi:uncharacterized protein (DUF1800 family)